MINILLVLVILFYCIYALYHYYYKKGGCSKDCSSCGTISCKLKAKELLHEIHQKEFKK